MGWRKSGEKSIKEEEIQEQFCDICEKTMKYYPQLELKIEFKEYEWEGDEPEFLDICSPECLAIKAEKLKGHWRIRES